MVDLSDETIVNITWHHFDHSGKGGGFGKGDDEFSLSSAVSIREVAYQVDSRSVNSIEINHLKPLKPMEPSPSRRLPRDNWTSEGKLIKWSLSLPLSFVRNWTSDLNLHLDGCDVKLLPNERKKYYPSIISMCLCLCLCGQLNQLSQDGQYEYMLRC